jgi:hypothetical protein
VTESCNSEEELNVAAKADFDMNIGNGNVRGREYTGPNGERIMETRVTDASGREHVQRFQLEEDPSLPPDVSGVIEMKDGTKVAIPRLGPR